MSERRSVSRIKHIRHDSGVWVVGCRICGKAAKRVFLESRSDDPKGAALAYWDEHVTSVAHAAAVEAYRLPTPPESSDEALARKIFGVPEPSDEQRRLRAASRAYKRAGVRRGSR